MNQTIRQGTKHKSEQERRDQILDGAMSCFIEKGFHSTTMKDLVACIGLSQGAIYHYFDNKETIVLGIWDRFIDATEQEIQQIEQSEDYVEGFKKHMLMNLEPFQQIYRFSTVNQELRDNGALSVRYDRCSKAVQDSISAHLKRSNKQHHSLEYDDISIAVFAMIEGLFSMSIDCKDFPLKQQFLKIWNVIEFILK